MNKCIIGFLILLTSCAGKKNIQFIYWEDKSGVTDKVKFKMETTDDVVDGYCWHYYKNGQLMSKTRYEDNKLMEIYRVYDTSGNRLNHGSLMDGNGYVIFYDDKKGTKDESGPYKDGLRNGWWRRYDFRENLVDSILFEDGINEGFDFYLYILY